LNFSFFFLLLSLHGKDVGPPIRNILSIVAAHLGMDPNGYKKSLSTRHPKMKTTTIQTLAELESKGSGLRFEMALP
jgi:hypothetical protein